MHNFSYLRVISMGGHLFFQTWICMAMIFEPYLRCYSSIFSQTLVFCSWYYGLSAFTSSILNRDIVNVVKFFKSFCQKHITLICQHDKLPLVIMPYISFSVWIFGPWYLKNRINNHVEIFTVSLSLSGIENLSFFSVITQPWRHPGAILCFDVIIDIFISVYHKLTKFNTHKLQVIRQHTDNPCPRARHDAHVRARQNFNMLKITYKQFWVRTRSFRAFQNFPSVRVRACVVRARSANEWQKFKIFTWFWFLIRQLTISIYL